MRRYIPPSRPTLQLLWTRPKGARREHYRVCDAAERLVEGQPAAGAISDFAANPEPETVILTA